MILSISQSLSVAVLLIPIIFLMIHDRNQAVLWPSVGVVILLFSRWSWHLDSTEAGIGPKERILTSVNDFKLQVVFPQHREGSAAFAI